MLVIDAEDRSAAEEAELVAQIAAGEIEAPMTELYRRYSRRLYRFGLQVLGNAGLAEEMVQESFVRLWLTAPGFDARRASVGTYLYVIARSVAADILWVPEILSPYATWEYSWISPPRRSRRKTRVPVTPPGGCTRPAGAACFSARCGLCEL
jgi:hypothetical protein